jgi:hypothetical protein
MSKRRWFGYVIISLMAGAVTAAMSYFLTIKKKRHNHEK